MSRRSTLLITSVLLLDVSACSSQNQTSGAQSRQLRSGSRSLDQAEEMYRAGNHAEAAPIFRAIVSGEIAASSEDRARAEFWLGKSFFQLGDYLRALELMGAIGQNPQHDYYQLAIPWLASLGVNHPDPNQALAILASYPRELLEDEVYDDVRDELDYRLGRWHAQHGDPQTAEELLARVPIGSDYAIGARFELGELRWRQSRGDEALDLHRMVVQLWSNHLARSEGSESEELETPPEVEAAQARLRSQGVPVPSLE